MLDRHDAEHRLANLVSRWVQAREEKSLAMREHNDTIKQIEEAIEGLSAEIQRGQFQPSLPLEAPADDGPTIFLAADDEDEAAPADTASEADDDVDADSEETDDEETTDEPTLTGEVASSDPDNPCLRCTHPRSQHTIRPIDDTRPLCSVHGCGCAGYVDSDPLGVADHNPTAEKGGDHASR